MFLIMGAAAIVLFTVVTMLLWNWLVPVLFSGPIISFWQAAGLLVLSKILFGGFGGGGKSKWKKKHRCNNCGHTGDYEGKCGPRSHWKNKFQEKMNKMSDEDNNETIDSESDAPTAEETEERTE